MTPSIPKLREKAVAATESYAEPWEHKKSPFEVYNIDHGALKTEIVSGYHMIAAMYDDGPVAAFIAAANPAAVIALCDEVERFRAILAALEPFTRVIVSNVEGWQKDPNAPRHDKRLGYTVKATCGAAYAVYDAMKQRGEG